MHAARSTPPQTDKADADTKGVIPKALALPTPKSFAFVPAKDIPRRQFLCGPAYQRGNVTLTIAAPGAGKTSLGIAEAVFMASGRGLLDAVEAPLKVWLFNGEEPIVELERRIAGVVAAHDLDRNRIAENLFCNSGLDQPLVLGRAQRGADSDRIAALFAASIKAVGIDVVIVDPFVSTHVEQENDNGAIDGVSKLWAQIAKWADCAIHLVHHTRKSGYDALTAESVRGASSLVATARFVRTLTPLSEAEALTHRGVSDEPCVQAEVVKSNNSRFGEKRFFTIRAVDIGNGDGTGPGDIVGVIVPIAAVADRPPLVDPALHEAIAAAFTSPLRGSDQVPGWAGEVLATVLGLKADTGKRALSLRLDHLVKIGVLHGWTTRTPNGKDVPWIGLKADAEAARAAATQRRPQKPGAFAGLTPAESGPRAAASKPEKRLKPARTQRDELAGLLRRSGALDSAPPPPP